MLASRWLPLAGMALLLVGCANSLKEEELAGVARDWALTIRASQVVPVYPLVEDLQPGDVFLVTTPIQQQASQYSKKGFLPLDQHMTRLSGLDFKTFYDSSFGTVRDDGTLTWPSGPPDLWRFPEGVKAWAEPVTGKRSTGPSTWTRAPFVYFPTYTFKVRSGKGISLAIPIQSVPVGLGVMQTDAATGSAAISDASTYGVSLSQINGPLTTWAGLADVQTMLRRELQLAGHQIYVRAVNRVFLARELDVTLSNDRAFGASGRVGAAPEVSFPELTPDQVAENVKKIGEAANTAPSVEIGGAVKVTFATSRTVHAKETFKRPLVIGYIAFDFPVMGDGSLGPPAMTTLQLEGAAQPVPGVLSEEDQSWTAFSFAASALPPNAQKALLTDASKRLGTEFVKKYEEAKPAENGAWIAFRTASSGLNVSSQQLCNAIRLAWAKVRPDQMKD